MLHDVRHWALHRFRCYVYSHVLLTEDRGIFLSVVAHAVCVAVGPLFIGEVFKGHFGAFSVWGLVSFTDWSVEANGDAAMLLFPLVFGVLWPAQHLFALHSMADHCAVQKLKKLPCRHSSLLSLEGALSALLMGVCALWLCLFVGFGYGITALALSPCVVWAQLRYGQLLWQRLRLEWRMRSPGSVESQLALQEGHLRLDRLK